jgi:hypothetical protein
MKAIIYLPGLGVSVFDQSVDSVALRLKKAIDINNPLPSSRYSVEVRKENYGLENNLTTQVALISETGGNPKNAIDLYELDYAKELTTRFENQNVILKTFQLFIAIASNLHRVFGVFFTSKALTIGARFQFLYAMIILLTLAIFGLLLVASFPVFLAETVKPAPGSDLQNFFDHTYLGNVIVYAYESLVGKSEYFVGIFAGLYLIFPDLKNRITILATEFVCLINYFSLGERRLGIIGKFEDLLEHIAEQNSHQEDNQGNPLPKYDEVIILAYSFGSLIALDVLFPSTQICSERTGQKVKTLITIGCPFDLIRAYWPRYYKDRVVCSKLQAWYNIYSSSDALSSNFRDDDLNAESSYTLTPDAIKPTNVSFDVIPHMSKTSMNFFLLMGFRAHRLYWDEQRNSASCFNNLVLLMKSNGHL